MSRRSKEMREMSEMSGGALIAPQLVAVEEGRQEMLKQSHIKVDSRYFAIDPNLDFEASTILCEDRVYVSDQTPDPNQPLTFTIQPQFNVFRSLSESRFVFLLQAVIGSPAYNPALPELSTDLALVPKPYWSALFINNFVCNINNVACNDQHSRTASYAHFIKTILLEGNLKTAHIVNTPGQDPVGETTIVSLVSDVYGVAGEDLRTLTEGIINTDYWVGIDEPDCYNNNIMSSIAGFLNNFGSSGVLTNPVYNVTPGEVFDVSANLFVPIELTYRPKDGIFIQPKLLPPGVNLNYVMNFNSLGTWCNGYTMNALAPVATLPLTFSIDPDSTSPIPYTYKILRAQYYERQYTITQTGLRAYQSLIMRQPLYYSCLTSNTLLFPVATTQQSVQLTNVFAGRLPNIVVVGLLNQSATLKPQDTVDTLYGNSMDFLTYSPHPTRDRYFSVQTANPFATVVNPADCINSCILTVNGRVYPHLWTSNMLPRANQDLSQWYECYRQCALISRLNGRDEGATNSNYDPTYKMDNCLLSFGEFKSNFTFLCFNIRRNGTIVNRSGDKEVGALDILVNINGSFHPSAQLMVVGLNTDSLLTISDGGSSSSFVF